MSSSNSNYIYVLNDTIVFLYKYIVPVLFILGNLGNILSAMVFAKKTWRKNVCVFYLNICLLIDSACINSYILGTMFILGFNIQIHNSSAILCKLYYYVSSVFSTVLPGILISASVDRLLISSRNVDTRLYSSKRLAYLSVSICLIVWVIFNCHLLIRVNIQKISPSDLICFYDFSKIYIQFLGYASLIITFSYCLIMIILLKLAFKNVRRILAFPREQRKQIRSMTKKDFQLLHCLFVQDIVYIVCNIFLNVYYVYAVARMDQNQTSLEATISDFLHKILNFLQFIPFCGSFFIFMVVSKVFRNELKRMMYKMIGKNLTPIHEEENRQEHVRRDSVKLNVVNTAVSS